MREYQYLYKQNTNTAKILFFNIELTNEEMVNMTVLEKTRDLLNTEKSSA